MSDPATEVERISPKSISVRRPVTISVGEVQLRGGALPDGAVEVAAGETLTWSASYAPLTHSTAEGDISAVATFAEDVDSIQVHAYSFTRN